MLFPLGTVSVSENTVSNTHNLKDERFNLAQGFRGFSAWSPGSKQEHHGRRVRWSSKMLSSSGLGNRAGGQCQSGMGPGLDTDPKVIPPGPTQTQPGACPPALGDPKLVKLNSQQLES